MTCSSTPSTAHPRHVSLPVVSSPADTPAPSHGPIKKSRSARWRAAVLILVHVVIGIHILLWMALGLTLSPVEPSESVQTITQGVVNAGFVFFVVSVGSTLLFGRFFCGWGCHVVALQDLCSHVMTRLGVRPKPFRSRLLVWVPVGLAFYMFAWPLVHRHIITPLFSNQFGELPVWLSVSGDVPLLSTEFLVDDFWATFPPWYIAIPFLAVCGFATVYFLGSKGFCTYGCPYGGLFGPADLVSIGRIKVNDACEGCGHCTAVCTSNVRVHEEVRDFGQVMDPGCMKCMDCVSVCPNHALHFGFGSPSILKKPTPHKRLSAEEAKAAREKARASRRARFDLSWPEELIVAALFVAFLLSFRGMLDMVPLLMAVAMAAIAAFCCWRSWSMLSRKTHSARVQNVSLKHKDRLTWTGRGFVLLTLALVAAATWSGVVRYHLWRAGLEYAQMRVALPTVLRPEFVPSASEYAAAQRGIAFYTRGDAVFGGTDRGGQIGASGDALDGTDQGGQIDVKRSSHPIGWGLAPDHEINLAYLYCITGDFAAAESRLRAVIERGNPTDSLVFQLGEIIRRRLRQDVLAAQARGTPREQLQQMIADIEDEVDAAYRWAMPLHDNLLEIRTYLELADRRKALAGGTQLPESAMGLNTDPEPAGDEHTAARADERLARIEQRLALASDDQRAAAVAALPAQIDAALAAHHVTPDTKLRAARLLASGDPTTHRARVLSLIDSALADASRRVNGRPGGMYVQAAGMLVAQNEPTRALTVLNDGIAKDAGTTREAATLSSAGELMMRLSAPTPASPQGDAVLRTRATDTLAQAAAKLTREPWDLGQLGTGMVRAGVSLRDAAVVDQGLRAAADATIAYKELTGDEPPMLRYDHAAALLMAGKPADALAQAQQAVAAAEAAAKSNAAPMNAVFLLNMAELAARAGRMDIAQTWGERGEELLRGNGK